MAETVLKGKGVLLRDKCWEDLERDHKWKSDPEIARLDATLPINISLAQFRALYIYQPAMMDTASRTFAIETMDGEHIGNCMYYNLDPYAHTVEIGIIIGEPAYWNRGYGTEAVNLLLRHLFRDERMKLRKIYLHTLHWNTRAKRAFEKCGFSALRVREREGYVFIVMELERSYWEKISSSRNSEGEAVPPMSPTTN